MKIIIVYIVSLLTIISCQGHKKSRERFGDTVLPAVATNHNRTEVRYDLDTVLKNGYYLKFRIDSDKQSIFLVKGHDIAEIASTSLGLPFRMLGYKISDFPQQFVFGHSNGTGNPVYIELIDKKTGSNLIKQGSIFLDADETNELLLYAEDNFRVKKKNIFLFDAKKNIKELENCAVDFYTHGGKDGPAGDVTLSKGSLKEETGKDMDANQLARARWQSINFNFDPNRSV